MYKLVASVIALLCAAQAWARTYSIEFAKSESLDVEFTITSKAAYAGLYENSIAGTITNRSRLPVRCVSIAPVTTYSSDRSLLLFISRVDLGVGENMPFSLHDSASTRPFDDSDVTAWKASGCVIPLEYKLISTSVKQTFAKVTVKAALRKSQIAVSIENNSDEPVEVVWNESSFINEDRVAGRIFHTGVRYTDRDKYQPNSVIPPHARLEEAVVPTSHVDYQREVDGGWVVDPILIEEVLPGSLTEALALIRGAKVTLFLQLVVSDKKRPATLTFEVVDVRPTGTGGSEANAKPTVSIPSFKATSH